MMVIASSFNSYSRYYDLLYRDKDYVGESDYIQALLSRLGITNGDVLEFGSGTGKHGCLLASRGYSVHGVERSHEMISQAKFHDGFTCEQGDICSIQLNRNFDAVLSLFHVISYQITNANLNAVFANANQHLRHGGLFIFDFWYSPAVYFQRPSVRVKKISDKQLEIVRIAEPVIYPNQNRVDVNYTIFASDLVNQKVEVINEIHSMRHFSLPEVNLLAEKNGFEFIGSEEFLTGKSASEDTWGVCVILKKMMLYKNDA
jgi:SAM-dependent methyltransferase